MDMKKGHSNALIATDRYGERLEKSLGQWASRHATMRCEGFPALVIHVMYQQLVCTRLLDVP